MRAPFFFIACSYLVSNTSGAGRHPLLSRLLRRRIKGKKVLGISPNLRLPPSALLLCGRVPSSAQGRGSSHRGQQHIERVRIVMTYPVDEEGRGTAHSAMPPAFGVLVHPIGKNMVL